MLDAVAMLHKDDMLHRNDKTLGNFETHFI